MSETSSEHKIWLNWLVVNVPGDQVHLGLTLREYLGPIPDIKISKSKRIFEKVTEIIFH